MEKTINKSLIQLVEGDITTEDVDAIVNAANSRLMGGGGVDGAIHRAGGPAILEECKTLGGCPAGEAKITTGGKLKAKYVIHTVGPIYHGGDRGEPELLESCHRRSLEVASENGCKTVAFPAISTGVYGYPREKAAPVALETVKKYLEAHTDIEVVRFVLFGRSAYDAFAEALEKL
ncbi:O-acetyl-ADP-ribose deacetylase [Candidatus Hydrogenedentota bacterium]